MWRTTNNGESWSTLGALMSDVNDIAFTDSSIFVCGRSGIQKATNDGTLWTTVDSLILDVQTNSIIITSNNNIITGSRWRGFTRSTDGGASWERINDNFRHPSISSPTVRVFLLELHGMASIQVVIRVKAGNIFGTQQTFRMLYLPMTVSLLSHQQTEIMDCFVHLILGRIGL